MAVLFFTYTAQRQYLKNPEVEGQGHCDMN